MTLENILLEIEERKKQELLHLEGEFQKKREAIDHEIAKGIEDLRISYMIQREEEFKVMERRSADIASLESRKILNQRRSELISDALARADQMLTKEFQGKKYESTLIKMHESAVKILGKDVTVLVDSKDKVALETNAFKAVPVSEGIRFGAIFQSADGKREIDLTLPAISKYIREKISEHIAGKFVG